MGDQVTGSVQDQLDLSPEVWFIDRQLDFTPSYFTVAKTSITDESVAWILSTLKGRFSLQFKHEHDLSDTLLLGDIPWLVTVPAFEDPQEALLYELKWS